MNMSEYQHLVEGNSEEHHYGQPVVAQVHRDIYNQASQSATSWSSNGECLLFEFVLNFILTGFLCLLGFAGDTICFVTFWQEHHQDSAMTFLLQAVVISDLAVIWVIFVEDVIPGLGFIIPLLSDCHVVCERITVVTYPLLMLAQSSMIWLTLCTAVNHYLLLNRSSNSLIATSIEFVKKQVILIVACSIIVILPLTFDSSITVAHIHLDTKSIHTEKLEDNLLYKRIYQQGVLYVLVLLIPWLCVVYIAFKLAFMLHSMTRIQRAAANTSRTETTEITQVMLILCISLGVCYMPTVIQGIAFWINPNQPLYCGHFHYYLNNFCNMFKGLHSCLKLVIFGLFQPNFVQAVHETFCRGRSCCKNKRKTERVASFRGYQCQDMSEMTLMSNIEDQHRI